jgi:cysteine desulfurase/selenocysteine lyase
MDPVRRYDSQVAVTARSTLDAQKLRADFPIFEQKIHGKPLAYLDSAVTSQKPRQMLDAMRTFYETSYANVHRGVYTLSERATAEFEQARQKVAGFVNAPSAREVIFTRQATEALNLVAYAWGLNNLGPGDVVLVTELEHHSNFVPWQYIAKRTGAEFRLLPIDDNGELELGALGELDGRVKGRRHEPRLELARHDQPVTKLAAWAHEHGAIMVVDAAQGAPHHRVDVQELGCDFVAYSSHKLCGPSGVGALWGRAELLERMAPFNLGGHMIRSVRAEETTWGELPYKFEAGTMPIAEVVGFGTAMDYVSAVGLEAIADYGERARGLRTGQLAEVGGVITYGPAARAARRDRLLQRRGHPPARRGAGARTRRRRHPRRPPLLPAADEAPGRGRHHRASFYLYTVPEEIDRLAEGLHKARKILG